MTEPRRPKLPPVALVASLGVLCGVVIAGLSYQNSRSLIEQSQDRTRAALARGLVVALSDQLVVRDYAGLESRLLQAMADGSLASALVTDTSGTVLVHLQRDRPQAEPGLLFEPTQIAIPATGEAAGRSTGDLTTRWTAIEAGEPVGWLRLRTWPTQTDAVLDLLARQYLLLGALAAALLGTVLGSGYRQIRRQAEQREHRLHEEKAELERKLRTSLAAAAVAHEIKQPLTALLYEAAWLEAELKRPALPSAGGQESGAQPLIEAAESVSRQAREVSITVEKIRDVLRNVASQLAPIDLTDPIYGALLLAKADLTRYRIQLETQGLEEPVTVLGDREQLQLVVHNLIRNAIEATGADGHLRLALHRQAKAVELEVADDGPGFPQGPVDLDGLLMASSKSEGLGIGLYVVRCAVDNHNGSLEIGRSGLGGASVRLRFPLSTQA